MAEYKAGLRANGIKPPQGVDPKPVGEEREYGQGSDGTSDGKTGSDEI